MRLPTAPANEDDDRSFAGVGDDPTATVQCEAIPPDVLAADLEKAIRAELDIQMYDGMLEIEKDERDQLIAKVMGIELDTH